MERKNNTWVRTRGAVSNPTGRFETQRTVFFDDGWDSSEPSPHPLATKIHPETIRSLISKNQSPDVPFDQSVNPYKGCEHGCVYCFARPTHEYLGFSAGLEFETEIVSKPNAPDILRKELSRRQYKPKVLVLGANTDPYQPIERQLGISREILQVLSEFNQPVTILTKSAGILRDLDILESMAKRNLIHVYCSITTLDAQLAHRMEPRAAAPSKRLRVLQELSKRSISTGVLVSPIIPRINDSELETILEASARSGACCAGYILLRLPYQVKEIFSAWLYEHFPKRATRVLNSIRETRNGELYQNSFGVRMSGTGPYAKLLEHRFHLALQRNDLAGSPKSLNCELFEVPQARKHQQEHSEQLKLF